MARKMRIICMALVPSKSANGRIFLMEFIGNYCTCTLLAVTRITCAYMCIPKAKGTCSAWVKDALPHYLLPCASLAQTYNSSLCQSKAYCTLPGNALMMAHHSSGHWGFFKRAFSKTARALVRWPMYEQEEWKNSSRWKREGMATLTCLLLQSGQ